MPSSDKSSSIIFDRVCLTRGKKVLLSEVSLTLSEKRIGLIGNNGSGKSSFVRLLNGLLKPDKGNLIVHGVDANKSPEDLPRHVGFIFQNPDHQIIFPTVGEEISFGLQQLGATKKDAEAQTLKTLDQYGIKDWYDLPVHQLSEGQKHLICVIAVLVMKPALLVLDEAMTSLDLPTRLRLGKIIEELDQQVLLISHDLEYLKGFDRVLWIHEAQIIADGPPDEVTEAYRKAAGSMAGNMTINRTGNDSIK